MKDEKLERFIAIVARRAADKYCVSLQEKEIEKGNGNNPVSKK